MSCSTSPRRYATFALTVTVLAFAPHAAAAQNVLFVDQDGSEPANQPSSSLTRFPLNIGKKGLMVRFSFSSGGFLTDAAWPISFPANAISIKIDGNADLPCTAGVGVPAPFTCVYTAAPRQLGEPVRYAKVWYGSDFPANVSVTVTATLANVTFGGSTVNLTTTDPGGNAVNFISFTTATSSPPERAKGAVELVFDISGSMGLKAVPGGSSTTPTRMQVLKSAAEQFLMLAGGAAIAGDKVGAVYFSNNASATTPQLFAADNVGQRATLLGDIIAKNPTNGTSIGAGLKAAEPILTGTGATTNKYVLLFSDGEQNVPPCVGLPNSGSCTSVLDNTLIVDGSTYPIPRVCPIMAGQMSAPGWILQQKIGAIGCDNNSLKIRDGREDLALSDMQSFFAQVLTKVFPGDKIEIARDVSATIPANDSIREKFFVGSNDISMTVSLAWTATNIRLMTFLLQAPNGTRVDLSNSLKFGNHVTTATVRLPVFDQNKLVPSKGEWQVILGGNGISPMPYHLMVLLDNRAIASDFRITNTDIGTGEPITVQVRLTENETPVTGATVAVQLDGPQQGLGNMLATTSPSGTAPTTNDPYRDDVARKIALLASDPAYASLFATQGLPGMALLDDGQAGDAAANDGIYTGRFAATNFEGHYHFNLAVRGSSGGNGDFQRSWKLVTFVRAKPNPTNTQTTVMSSTTQAGGAVVHTIQIIPRDRFNRYLGPGYVGYMTVTPSAGTIVSPLVDKLNGSYQVGILVPPTQPNPSVTVVILGTPVVTRTIDQMKLATPSTAVSLHAGLTLPHSQLSSAFNGSLSLGADFEFKLASPFSIEAYLGHDRFTPKSGGTNFSLTHISLSGKATFGTGVLRPALDAGAGAYIASSSGGTHFGWSAGASLQYWRTSTQAFEGSYHFRDAKGGDLRYSTLQIGIRLGI